ncbi:hypothetical protein [Lewinella sp. LCG006]|uniref:hypothetical protein n=1 Tax=Lewinella sp. LCG006 TaxID=3231911 RepID=UPI003461133E
MLKQNALLALILMTFAYLPTVHAQTFVDAEYVQAETKRMKHLADSLWNVGNKEQSDAIQYDSLPNFLIGQFVNEVSIDKVYKGREADQLDGKNYVIHYTSYYCSPCHCKIAAINRIAKEYTDSIFQIVANDGYKYADLMSEKFSTDNCMIITEENPYFSSDQDVRLRQLLPLPSSVFIDASGKIIDIHIGAFCDKNDPQKQEERNYTKIIASFSKFN